MDNIVFTSVADLQKLIRGSSNSQSIEMLNSVMAETIGMSMYNAVSTQHNAQMLNSAATTSTCAKILSVIGVKAEPSSTSGSTPPALNSGTSPTGTDTQNSETTAGSTTDSNTDTSAQASSGASDQTEDQDNPVTNSTGKKNSSRTGKN